MKPIIAPVSVDLLKAELTPAKKLRDTNKSKNEIYVINHHDSPNVMQEIGRLREISFRLAGGGTGKATDIDEYDIDPHEPYRQLIVWDPKDKEIIGGYRYINCGGLDIRKMATKELFDFSDEFINEYMPFTIERNVPFIPVPTINGGRRIVSNTPCSSHH